MKAELRRRIDPRVRHVVGIADERDAQIIEPTMPLEQGEAVGQHLARVQPVRQPVDHRHGGAAANSTSVSCANVRAMIRSTQRSRLRAMSATVSR